MEKEEARQWVHSRHKEIKDITTSKESMCVENYFSLIISLNHASDCNSNNTLLLC